MGEKQILAIFDYAEKNVAMGISWLSVAKQVALFFGHFRQDWALSNSVAYKKNV